MTYHRLLQPSLTHLRLSPLLAGARVPPPDDVNRHVLWKSVFTWKILEILVFRCNLRARDLHIVLLEHAHSARNQDFFYFSAWRSVFSAWRSVFRPGGKLPLQQPAWRATRPVTGVGKPCQTCQRQKSNVFRLRSFMLRQLVYHRFGQSVGQHTLLELLCWPRHQLSNNL
jgi:hypothetical protein